jgi:hypothetical protein
MPGQGNRERPLHCRGDVPHVYERAVLPERLPLRPRLRAPLSLDSLILARVPDPHRAQRHARDRGPSSETSAQILREALGQAVGASPGAGARHPPGSNQEGARPRRSRRPGRWRSGPPVSRQRLRRPAAHARCSDASLAALIAGVGCRAGHAADADQAAFEPGSVPRRARRCLQRPVTCSVCGEAFVTAA